MFVVHYRSAGRDVAESETVIVTILTSLINLLLSVECSPRDVSVLLALKRPLASAVSERNN